jgi:malonyl-CoA O-methyltransferase
MLNSLIHKNFSRASQSYQEHAKVQYEIGQRLCERFDYYQISPSQVLDLGAGPGVFSHHLKKRFPKSTVTAFDLSEAMLKKVKRRWRSPIGKVVGNMNVLPFKDDAFELIFANQVIHWLDDSQALFKEISRVLKPKGVFVFSTLGPDTFKEINAAWQSIDDYSHVNQFKDMHDLGDHLLKTGFEEPVVDMEYITVRYENTKSLARDLKSQGVQHVSKSSNQGLVTPRKWLKFETSYEKFRDKDNYLPLTYEVIYGQAWGQAPKQSIGNNGEVRVPLSMLRK